MKRWKIISQNHSRSLSRASVPQPEFSSDWNGPCGGDWEKWARRSVSAFQRACSKCASFHIRQGPSFATHQMLHLMPPSENTKHSWNSLHQFSRVVVLPNLKQGSLELVKPWKCCVRLWCRFITFILEATWNSQVWWTCPFSFSCNILELLSSYPPSNRAMECRLVDRWFSHENFRWWKISQCHVWWPEGKQTNT